MYLNQAASSHVLGLYLFQNNCVLINMSGNTIVRAINILDSLGKKSTCNDHEAVTFHITYRHESNHFINTIASPWMVFMDDISDFYMSSLSHALGRHGSGKLDRPITKTALRPEVAERVGRAQLCRETKWLMFGANPTVGELVDHINQLIPLIALSRGCASSDCVTMVSDLPRNRRISHDGWTVLNLMEALARCSEISLLDKLGLTNTMFDQWMSRAFGTGDLSAYAVLFVPLIARLPIDIASVILTLAMRGSFYPYLGPANIRLEDVHPVLLLERMSEYAEKQYRSGLELRSGFQSAQKIFVNARAKEAFERGAEYGKHLETLCKEVVDALRKKFRLVKNPDEFLHNRNALDFNFPAVFPEVSESAQYRALKAEVQRLQTLRAIQTLAELANPLDVIHTPVVKADRFFATDMVFAASKDESALNELYKTNDGPILAHDRRLLVTALGEWAIFGDRPMIDTSTMIAGILNKYYAGGYAPYDPEEALKEAYGIECNFGRPSWWTRFRQRIS